MDLEGAVANLANCDDVIKLQAIEICKSFQTPPYFSWDTFMRLISTGSRTDFRLFGYQSLLNLVKNYWYDLNPNVRAQIESGFPFCVGDVMQDPLYETIINVDSVFLACASEIDMMSNAFSGETLSFSASLLANFVLSFCSLPLAPARSHLIREFLCVRGPELIRSLILNPLVDCEIGSAEFLFFLKQLADIHSSSELVAILIGDPEIVEIYARFVPFLWHPSDNGSIVAICESLLDTAKEITPITVSLGVSEQNLFVKGFSILFESSVNVDMTMYVSYLQSFSCRIPVFFQLLDKLSPSELGPFLEDTLEFLKSTAPSVIIDTVSMLSSLFRQYKDNEMFTELLRKQRIAIFERCVQLIATPMSSLPGAEVDENWCDFNARTSLFDLVKTIVELFDSQILVLDVIRILLTSCEETCLFVSLIRILSAVIKPPLDISDDAKRLVIFLLTSVNSFTLKTQNYVCTLLSKLLDYLKFDGQELNTFFQQLLVMFVSQKPAAFDPFTAFFNGFVDHFGSEIDLPLEQLQAVPPGDPCYFTISTLISRFTGKESPLDMASIELQWFVFHFQPDDHECMMRLSKNVTRSLEFLSNIQQLSSVTQSKDMILLLVQTNNVMVRAADNVKDERQAARFYSPMSHLAHAMCKFAEMDSEFFLQALSEISPPSLFSNCASLWVKKAAIPLLSLLFQSNEEIVRQIAIQWVGHFVPIIAEVEATPACVFEGTAKKIAAVLCQLCGLMSDEHAIEYMTLCLKFDDFRLYSAVVDACHVKGIQVLARLWEMLLLRQDQPSVDKLAGVLFDLWRENQCDFSPFLMLNGVSEDSLRVLSQKVMNASTDRRKRHYFRCLITK